MKRFPKTIFFCIVLCMVVPWITTACSMESGAGNQVQSPQLVDRPVANQPITQTAAPKPTSTRELAPQDLEWNCNPGYNRKTDGSLDAGCTAEQKRIGAIELDGMRYQGVGDLKLLKAVKVQDPADLGLTQAVTLQPGDVICMVRETNPTDRQHMDTGMVRIVRPDGKIGTLTLDFHSKKNIVRAVDMQRPRNCGQVIARTERPTPGPLQGAPSTPLAYDYTGKYPWYPPECSHCADNECYCSYIGFSCRCFVAGTVPLSDWCAFSQCQGGKLSMDLADFNNSMKELAASIKQGFSDTEVVDWTSNPIQSDPASQWLESHTQQKVSAAELQTAPPEVIAAIRAAMKTLDHPLVRGTFIMLSLAAGTHPVIVIIGIFLDLFMDAVCDGMDDNAWIRCKVASAGISLAMPGGGGGGATGGYEWVGGIVSP